MEQPCARTALAVIEAVMVYPYVRTALGDFAAVVEYPRAPTVSAAGEYLNR
jgi:hypothetical protein